ncbi:MAG: hypothetical protein IJ725_01830, partial [Ruminococcus sp.]|nr:hypothetical protein [Ruminococcus sp.]
SVCWGSNPYSSAIKIKHLKLGALFYNLNGIRSRGLRKRARGTFLPRSVDETFLFNVNPISEMKGFGI